VQVRIRHGACCGNAECVEIAPAVFALDSKNKVVVLDPEAVSIETLVDAAEACPCGALIVEDDEGNPLVS
jgi:ferredoxin